MLRSMYAGISGLRNFQLKLDVVGNNIANVNTFGFKKGRATFKDMVSQQMQGASASTSTRGGTNARQVGLGSQLASIDTVATQGSLQTTGRVLDLSISGDGYFAVASGKLVEDGAEEAVSEKNLFLTKPDVLYTRAGNFYLDKNGYVVNGDGLFLVGTSAKEEKETPATDSTPYVAGKYPPAEEYPSPEVDPANEQIGAIQIPTNAQSMNVGANGIVTFVDATGTLRVAGQVKLAKFANSEGLEKQGTNLYRDTANSGSIFNFPADTEEITPDMMKASFLQEPGANGSGKMVSGTLEMSNVDLSEEFTEMIVAQRGFQANTRVITTSDQILEELVNLKR